MKFWQNQQGNVAALAALCSAVIVLCGGVALDYGNAVRMETKLRDAADTAVLAGVHSAVDKLRENPMSTTWKEAAMAEASRVFDANLDLFNVPVKAVPSINFDQVNGKISGSIAFNADAPTQFMGCLATTP